MAKKNYRVESQVELFTGTRYTGKGNVVFNKGFADCTRQQAEYLVAKGYFCERLGIERKAPELSAEEKLIGVIQDLARVQDENKVLQARIDELEKKE